MNITVKGLDELTRKLNQQVPEVALNILRSAEKSAGRVFLAAEEQTIPVATGTARESLVVTSKVGHGTVLVQVGPSQHKGAS